MSIYERDRWYHFFVVLYINARIIVDIVRIIARFYMPSLINQIENTRDALYIVCAIYVVYLFLKYGINKIDIIFWVGSAVAFGVSLLISPQISSFISYVIMLFYSRILVGMVFFEHLTDYKKIIHIQLFFLLPTLIDAILMFSVEQTEGYMALSYNLIPSALFYMFYGLQNKKWLFSLSGIVIFFVTFIYGARGAVACGCAAIMIYMIVNFIRQSSKITIRNIAFFSMVLIVMVLIYVNWNNIIFFLSEQFGTSRTLSFITSENALSDSNRQITFDAMKAAIAESPILPNGLLADRFICAEIKNLTVGPLAYPHNYIYEIIYQFGIPLGCLFLLWNVHLIIRWFVKLKYANSNFMFVTISFVPLAFIQLMVSNSYLLNYAWGIAMGILLSKYNFEKAEQKNIETNI